MQFDATISISVEVESLTEARNKIRDALTSLGDDVRWNYDDHPRLVGHYYVVPKEVDMPT